MSAKPHRPALAVIGLGLVTAASAYGQPSLKITNTVPLKDMDRFAPVLSEINAHACFAEAARSEEAEAHVADGLYDCAIAPEFFKIQIFPDQASHRDHPGQPDLTVVVSRQPDGKLSGRAIVLRTDPPDPMVLADTDAHDRGAPTIRPTFVSDVSLDELVTAMPKAAQTVNVLKHFH